MQASRLQKTQRRGISAMAFNFTALVDEFKRTNWQDPGTWHVAPKLLVLLAVVVGIPVAAFFADTQSQIDELESGRNQETKLKEEYVGKEEAGGQPRPPPPAAARDRYPVRRAAAAIAEPCRWTRCSSTSTRRVSAAACSSNCSSRPPPKSKGVLRGAADPGEGRRQLPRHGRLRERRGQLSRIVTLNDVSIQAGKDGILTMDAVARTFRYLDDEEVAAQRKSQQAARKGGR